MDVPALMQRLAEADERRRAAPYGSFEQAIAQRELEQIATLIREATDGSLIIATGLPVFVPAVGAEAGEKS